MRYHWLLRGSVSLRAARTMAAALLWVALVYSSPVAAQSTWTGSVSNQWGNAANWAPLFPPPGASVTFGAVSNTDVDLGADRTVGVLTFNSAQPFSLNNNTLTINGGVQSLGTIVGTHTIASDVSVPNSVPWSIAADAPLEVSGAISGAGGINKLGAGVLTLSTANSYTGPTLVSAGQVVLADADALMSSTVVIGVDNGLNINGLNANLGGLAGVGDLDIGSQTVDTGLNDSDTTYSGVITGSSDSRLRHQGTGMLTLTGGTEATPSSFGTLRSQDENGTIVVDGARIDLTSADFSTTSGALLARSGNITFQNGADVRMADDSYAYATDAVITVSGSGTVLSGTELRASEPAGSTGSVIVESEASLDLTDNLIVGYFGNGDLEVQTGADASANLIIIGGVTDAIGTATVTGANSLLTADNNLFLGGIGSNQLGGTGTLVVDNDATVQVGNRTKFWSSLSSITVNGATLETNELTQDEGVVATVSISDPAGSAALTIGTGDGSSTFDGLIQDAAGGAGSLTKVGTGTFTLTGANTFSGGVVFEGGIVAIDSDANLGDSSGPLTFNGGELQFESSFDLSSTRPITLNSGGGTIHTMSNSTTISQAITGMGDLTKEGDGALTLAGANTYSGDTHINNGTVVLDDIDALQNSTVYINVDNGLDINTQDAKLGGLAGSGNLEIGSQEVNSGYNDTDTTYSGVITGSSASKLQQQGSGTLTLTGGTVATPSSFGTLRSQNGDGTIVIDGAHLLLTSEDFSQTTGPFLVRTGDVILQNAAAVEFAAGTGVVNNGVLTVSGAGTTLIGGGLRISTGSSADSTAIFEQGAAIELGGNLILSEAGTSHLTVQIGATVTSDLTDLARATESTADLLVTDLNSLFSTRVLHLGGRGDNTPGGTGTLTVANGAAVEVAEATIFCTSASSIIVDEATFSTDTLVQETGITGTISINDSAGDAALVVGTGDGDSTFGGLIEDVAGGRGSLKKVGAGTLTLTGVNTYTGDTIVEGGTLSLAQDFLADNSDVVLDADATLDLTHGLVDTVDEFWLAGFSRAVGTHGAIGSGADFEWAEITGTGMLEVTDFAGLAGDYNADGVVNLADYTVWRNNLGAAAGTLVNDIDGGVIGSSQYDTWKANFGASVPTPALNASVVPEPKTLLLLFGGLLSLAGHRFRARHRN